MSAPDRILTAPNSALFLGPGASGVNIGPTVWPMLYGKPSAPQIGRYVRNRRHDVSGHAPAGMNGPWVVVHRFATAHHHPYEMNRPEYRAANGRRDVVGFPPQYRRDTIHAPFLHTGHVLPLAGSGNNLSAPRRGMPVAGVRRSRGGARPGGGGGCYGPVPVRYAETTTLAV